MFPNALMRIIIWLCCQPLLEKKIGSQYYFFLVFTLHLISYLTIFVYNLSDHISLFTRRLNVVFNCLFVLTSRSWPQTSLHCTTLSYMQFWVSTPFNSTQCGVQEATSVMAATAAHFHSSWRGISEHCSCSAQIYKELGEGKSFLCCTVFPTCLVANRGCRIKNTHHFNTVQLTKQRNLPPVARYEYLNQSPFTLL